MKHKLGRTAQWSAEHRTLVLVATALLMSTLGIGVMNLEFEDNLVDAMPKGDPHTIAAQTLIDEFPGASYTAAVFLEVNPDRWAQFNAKLPNRVPMNDQMQQGQEDFIAELNDALDQASNGQAPQLGDYIPGPLNITDEVYMRATEEFFEFMQAEIPEMKWGITLPSQIKLVNYTNTGIPNPIPGQDSLQPPDPASFTLPGTDPAGSQQFTADWQSYYQASPASVRTIVSPDFETSRSGLLFEPGGKSLTEMGRATSNAIAKYRVVLQDCQDKPSQCELEWAVFDPKGVTADPRGPSVAAAYLSDLTLEDLLRLGPIVALFIGASLFLAFRRIGVVTAMTLPMGLAGIGVLGTFGLLGLPIHSVSMLVFPVLMGNGIDFAIHMATAYNEARVNGKNTHEAAFVAGERSGNPLFIASLTTIAGMLLLVFAPNQMLSQLGLSIMLGMALLLLISLTALPAALTFTKPKELRGTALGIALQKNARFWHKNKWIGLGIIVILMGVSVSQVGKLDTLVIGTPAAFFPEGDKQREDFDHTNEAFYEGREDLVTNALVVRGDITRPEAMAFMRAMEIELQSLEFVRAEATVSIHFALNAWIQVREGTAGAPLVIAQEAAQPGSTFPQTQAEIKFLLDEMFNTPLATYATFFASYPDYETSNMLVELNQPGEFDELEKRWNELQAAITRVHQAHPDSGLEVHLSGATSMGYLFAKKELPYVQWASLAGLAFTGFLVLAIRRSPRDAVTVAAVVGGSGLLWSGTLSVLDVPLSVALVVPVVMIAAIGSDYALHLRYGLAKEGSKAWQSVGRAVMFSAITDLGAFLIFTQMRYGILRQATLATVVALTCCLVVTLIMVPILSTKEETEIPPQHTKFQTIPPEDA